MTGHAFAPETIQRFASSLLHFIWQGAAIALLTSFCLRLLQRRSAEVRYAVSVAALIAMLMAPVLTFIFYKEAGALALQLLQITGKALTDAAAAASMTQAATTAAWTQWILATWSIGVFAFTARLVAGWRDSRRLVGDSETIIPQSVLQVFADLKQQMALIQPVQLLIHARIDTPMVVGCLRPAVLVPVSALTGLNEEQLTAILAHELAHIRRHDFLINILQRGVESLLFYHPGVWWLSARIRAEREHCCDDVAIRVCGDRRIYVQALIELERKRQAVPALSVAATGGSMVQRVHRILGIRTSSSDWQSAVATLAFVLIWIVVGAWQSSSRLQAKPVLMSAPPPAAVILPALASPAPVAESINAIAAIIMARPIAEPQTAPPAALQGNTAKSTIEGVILSDVTGDPIAGAEVGLGAFVGRSNIPPQPSWSEVTPIFSTVTTGPDGHYSFKNIDASTYRIIAIANGFIRQEYGQKTPYGAGKPVYVVAGKTLKDVNVRLQATGVVSGRILQDSGQPAIGVSVRVLHPTYNAQGRTLTSVGMTTADDRGEYRIFGIAPGRYYLMAGTSPDAPRQFVIVGNPNQSPLGNYGLVFYPGVTDVDQATMIELKPGIDSHIDMRVAKRREYHIRGRVIDATTGQPPENVQFSLSYHSFDGFDLTMPAVPKYDPATGDFDLPNAAPGNYILKARNQNSPPAFTRNPEAIRAQFAEEARKPYGQASVTVSTADIDNLSLMISPGATIQARLFVEGQEPIELSHFLIELALEPYGMGTAGFFDETPPISPDGTFSLSGIREGDYQLQLNELAHGFYLKSVTYAGMDVMATPIRINGSKRELLEITVQRGTGTLSGVVTDRRNDPVAGIPVALVPDQRKRGDNYRIGLTEQDGSFSIGDIPPGSYKIFSWEESEPGAYFDPEFVERYEQLGRPVVIRAGLNPNVDVRLIPAP